MGLYLATMIRHRTRFVDRNSAADISRLPEKELGLIITELTKYLEKEKIGWISLRI